VGDVNMANTGESSASVAASRMAHKDRTYYVEPRYRDHLEVKHPLQAGLSSSTLACERWLFLTTYLTCYGLVTDWDVVEKLWFHVFYERMNMDPKEHPILLAESSFNTVANREKATEIAFEKFETGAMFVSKNAVLTAYNILPSSKFL